MVEAIPSGGSAGNPPSKEDLLQALSLYKRFFFNSIPERRSRASCEVDRVLRRERGKDATLGVEIVPRTRKIGMGELTYGLISKVFQYLDAKVILGLYRAASAA